MEKFDTARFAEGDPVEVALARTHSPESVFAQPNNTTGSEEETAAQPEVWTDTERAIERAIARARTAGGGVVRTANGKWAAQR